jgi:hypothetical protein
MVRSPSVVVGCVILLGRRSDAGSPSRGRPSRGYEPAGLVESCNFGFAYVEFVVLPIPLTEMITEMIRAKTTAYSTAVGPSSFFRKSTTA